MPTPAPGLKRVPRWRTMISPPVTVWPAKTFTPRRLAFESRPLREEPRPFLCAMADLRDLDSGQVLTMPRAALVAALGLELEHAQLLAADVLDDLRADADLLQAVGVEDRVLGAEQDGLEVDAGTGLAGQALHQERLALLDAVLLAAGLDDRVHEGEVSSLRGSLPPPSRQRNGAVRLCGHGAGALILGHRRRTPHSPCRRRRPARRSPRCGLPARCAPGASRRRARRRCGPRRCSRRSWRRRRRRRTCAARRSSRGPRRRRGTGSPARGPPRRCPP